MGFFNYISNYIRSIFSGLFRSQYILNKERQRSVTSKFSDYLSQNFNYSFDSDGLTFIRSRSGLESRAV